MSCVVWRGHSTSPSVFGKMLPQHHFILVPACLGSSPSRYPIIPYCQLCLRQKNICQNLVRGKKIPCWRKVLNILTGVIQSGALLGRLFLFFFSLSFLSFFFFQEEMTELLVEKREREWGWAKYKKTEKKGFDSSGLYAPIWSKCHPL